MMKNQAHKDILKSESGQMTLDFLYGATLIIGTGALICALTMGLTLIETIQYVSFSSARAYFAADQNPAAQEKAAKDQMQSLLKELPFLSGAMRSEWIVVRPRGAKNYKDYAQGKGADNLRNNQFVGYQFEVELPLLSFSIPLFSSVMKPSGAEDVSVTISSFLMREPTTQECVQFNKGLYSGLLSKDNGYGAAASSAGGVSGFVAINDNGC
jgi:hypothetical protein